MSNNDIIIHFDDKKDKTLSIKLEKVPEAKSCLLINLEGIIETYNSLFFQSQMNKILDAGFINLIISGKTLKYVSSTGVGSLISLYRQIKLMEGSLIFIDFNDSIMEVLKLLGFSKVFCIKETIEEAISEINKNNVFIVRTSSFPFSFECPLCKAKLKAPYKGKYKCLACKSTIAVMEDLLKESSTS